jgi:hypothetical protein
LARSVAITYEEQDEVLKDIEMVYIKIGRTFKLTELYIAQLCSQRVMNIPGQCETITFAYRLAIFYERALNLYK